MNYLDQALTSTYSASGVLLPGTGGVPIAPELHANPVVAWVSIVLAYAGAAAALAWALWKLVKHQQMLPLVLFAAGLVAANIEPLGDLVGSIVYANDTPWFGYTVMGRRMPAWIWSGRRRTSRSVGTSPIGTYPRADPCATSSCYRPCTSAFRRSPSK